ncbi:hypothetical protein HRbin17_02696 [bacterium HR17]|jgi:hypothetical protein|uniref:Uncharacterized protein n=1 Tax=Candidatus Fervidibacter japonicus TaxID=2035412 RepID=A0A2H5XG47_9BACT|nr:hypothetical protein HRbin17_02696 [bacterium HR17]
MVRLGFGLFTNALMLVLAAWTVFADEQQVVDDPAARQFLKAAHEARHVWHNFPGFTAQLTFVQDGHAVQGTVTVIGTHEVQVQIADEKARRAVTEMLRSLVAHRSAVPFEQGPGKYPIAFGTPDQHPLGQLVRLGDSFRSAYRIKDGHIRQVIRHLGDKRMTITVLEETPTDDGWLPHHFTVAWWRDDGTLLRVDAFSDRYVKVGSFWLPAQRRVVTAAQGQLSTTVLQLERHRLLEARRSQR